ncbi:MAG: hypothetical protein JW788_04755 [Candidatus Omnitrophica bacterium]|nr:hypothetical protein [Candidatus Omnitrophota bacterium]
MKKTKTSHKGRRCRFPRCNNILSIYNHEAYCHVHLRQMDRSKKPKASKK